MLASVIALTMVNLPPSFEAKREFRAAWVATVDNIDWPSKKTLSKAEQVAELDNLVRKASELNLNALIFQVRPSCDALYESKLEPWSEYLTGQQGRDPGWDPLKHLIAKCHKAGIELHAWFNPYRAWHPAAKGKPAANYIGKTNPAVVKKYGSYEWMDPGEPAVQDRSFEVFMDVVRRYDVDGIHIDDYFYPYPEKGIDFPDAPSFEKNLENGGIPNRGDWRRKNVDDFVKRVYLDTKKIKPWVKFGISPFGIYRPGVPAGIQAGIDQYDTLYADALKWFVEGWCDYFTPQLYWPIAQKPQSYPVLLDWWVSQNSKKRHLWPGNFTSRVPETTKGWSVQEIINQIDMTRQRSGATGNVHFSMKAFLQDYAGINKSIKSGPYRQKAIIPASPWLSSLPVASPALKIESGKVRITVDEAKNPWVSVVRNGEVIRVNFGNFELTESGEYSITAYDRNWMPSPSVSAKL